MTADDTLDLGLVLIKEHRAPRVLFWLAEDWHQTWGAEIRRHPEAPERVISALQSHGRGFLVPDYHPN